MFALEKKLKGNDVCQSINEKSLDDFVFLVLSI